MQLFKWAGIITLSLLAAQLNVRADTLFSFKLDGSYATSAGVFRSDGTMIRTLWSNEYYGPGTISKNWDEKDDAGVVVPAGQHYTIKVLYHNTQYVFDGTIGNTSNPSTGRTVHSHLTAMHNLAIEGTNAFYAVGTNEGRTSMHHFSTTTPQQQTDLGHKDTFAVFDQVATDGGRVYFGARNSGFNPNTGHTYTFVTAFNVSDLSVCRFSAGVDGNTDDNPNNPDTRWHVIDYDVEALPPGNTATNVTAPTGIAVQKNGNVLAVAHGGLNVVRLFDKVSGSSIGSIGITNPEGLAFDGAGNLWIINGPPNGQVISSYAGLPANITPGPSITGLSRPVAVTVRPYGDVVVADAGASQQVKGFSAATGAQLWAYGQAGGYSSTNGPDVTNDKFGFQVGREAAPIYHTALASQPDNSLWVGDGITGRLLHIDAAGQYLEMIMYLPQGTTSTVDPHRPSRVIGDGFLEFEVNYAAPIRQSWTLKKNWRAGLEAKYFSPNGFVGLRSMVTFSAGQTYGQVFGNGRTYALLTDWSYAPERRELVEMPPSGPLRRIGILMDQYARWDLAGGWYSHERAEASLESDGSLRGHVIQNGNVLWFQRPLVGFDGAGNPQWGGAVVIASAASGDLDPIADLGNFGGFRYPITSGNVLVSFDPGTIRLSQSTENARIPQNGWHLGGVSLNGNQWQWRASRASTAPFDGAGSFLLDYPPGEPLPRPYAGTVVTASGKNIIYGYAGEFFRGAGQYSQWMHFSDNGLFIGQFGVPYDPNFEVSSGGSVPGSTSLAFFPSIVNVDSQSQEAGPGPAAETYLWTNDVSTHAGVARWHVLGANHINEMSRQFYVDGQGGTSIDPSPLNQTGSSPVSITAITPNNNQVQVTWASNKDFTYNVYMATQRGGPYTQVVWAKQGGSISMSHTQTGLENGKGYYFVVTNAITGAKSAEHLSYPFNGIVGKAGELGGGPMYPWNVQSSGPRTNMPALGGISSVLGNTARTNVGSKGYVIYGWGGAPDASGAGRQDAVNMGSGYSTTLGGQWISVFNGAKNHFRIDGIDGATQGGAPSLRADLSGTVTVTVPAGDPSVHYLTVFCPAVTDPDESVLHPFDVKLSSQSNPAAAPAVYSVNTTAKHNRIFQFEFTGNVVLTISKPQSEPRYDAALQAIFID